MENLLDKEQLHSKELKELRHVNKEMTDFIDHFLAGKDLPPEEDAIRYGLMKDLRTKGIEVDGCKLFYGVGENVEGSLYIEIGERRVRYRWRGDGAIQFGHTFVNIFKPDELYLSRGEKEHIPIMTTALKSALVTLKHYISQQHRYLASKFVESEMKLSNEVAKKLTSLPEKMREIDLCLWYPNHWLEQSADIYEQFFLKKLLEILTDVRDVFTSLKNEDIRVGSTFEKPLHEMLDSLIENVQGKNPITMTKTNVFQKVQAVLGVLLKGDQMKNSINTPEAFRQMKSKILQLAEEVLKILNDLHDETIQEPLSDPYLNFLLEMSLHGSKPSKEESRS